MSASPEYIRERLRTCPDEALDAAIAAIGNEYYVKTYSKKCPEEKRAFLLPLLTKPQTSLSIAQVQTMRDAIGVRSPEESKRIATEELRDLATDANRIAVDANEIARQSKRESKTAIVLSILSAVAAIVSAVFAGLAYFRPPTP